MRNFEEKGRKTWHATKKKMNEGITEHSTRCFQCPPQGVAPCGALLPFEGTLKRKGLDQKIRNYANENKNTWRSLSNIHEYRNHGSQYPPQGVSPCGTLLLLLRRGIEMKWTPFIHYQYENSMKKLAIAVEPASALTVWLIDFSNCDVRAPPDTTRRKDDCGLRNDYDLFKVPRVIFAALHHVTRAMEWFSQSIQW